MKKLYLLVAALCLLLCQPQQAQAEILTYEGVGEYYMEEENISLSEAKDKAKLMAEVAVVEQASVKVASTTEVQKSKLTKDEIELIAAGIIKVQDVKYNISSELDTLLVKAVVKAEIDTDEIPALVEQELAKRKKA